MAAARQRATRPNPNIGPFVGENNCQLISSGRRSWTDEPIKGRRHSQVAPMVRGLRRLSVAILTELEPESVDGRQGRRPSCHQDDEVRERAVRCVGGRIATESSAFLFGIDLSLTAARWK